MAYNLPSLWRSRVRHLNISYTVVNRQSKHMDSCLLASFLYTGQYPFLGNRASHSELGFPTSVARQDNSPTVMLGGQPVLDNSSVRLSQMILGCTKLIVNTNQ